MPFNPGSLNAVVFPQLYGRNRLPVSLPLCMFRLPVPGFPQFSCSPLCRLPLEGKMPGLPGSCHTRFLSFCCKLHSQFLCIRLLPGSQIHSFHLHSLLPQCNLLPHQILPIPRFPKILFHSRNRLRSALRSSFHQQPSVLPL